MEIRIIGDWSVGPMQDESEKIDITATIIIDELDLWGTLTIPIKSMEEAKQIFREIETFKHDDDPDEDPEE